MACLTPITLKNEKFTGYNFKANKVPCGKCPECLKARQNQWAFRLQNEQAHSSSACFVTITYMDDFLPHSADGLATLHKKDIQLYLKRLRKRIGKQSKIKYYAVGEYGTKSERPHYHMIIFNLPEQYAVTDEYNNSPLLTKIWNYGHVRVDECNIKTIKYVAKYVMKKTKREQRIQDGIVPEFSLMSKQLGMNFLTPQMTKFLKTRLQPYITIEDGKKQSMPRYYREKIFTIEDRARMRLKGEIYRNMEFPYQTYEHEFEYIKDQYRKQNKIETLKRSQL